MVQLLYLLLLKHPKQVIRFLRKMVVRQKNNQNNIPRKKKQYPILYNRYFLNGLPVFPLADLTRTILGFFFIDQAVHFTSDADAEGGFEKEEDEADQADDAGDRTKCIYYIKKDKHGPGQNNANYQGKFFLFCSPKIWVLFQ